MVIFIFLWIKCSFSSVSYPLVLHTLNFSTSPCRPSSLFSPLSCLDHSDYQESSGSGSAEDEYQPVRRPSPQVGMTRLDPPPHRPSPRAWMEEAQSRDGFRSRSGTQRLTLCFFMLFIQRNQYKMSQSVNLFNGWILKAWWGEAVAAPERSLSSYSYRCSLRGRAV